MKTQDLYLVYRPSTATDSMGGDLPWQSYLYVTEDGLSVHPNDAELHLTREAAEQAFHPDYRFRVGTLEDAITWYGIECRDRTECNGW